MLKERALFWFSYKGYHHQHTPH